MRKGFTLVEMLVVISVLLIISVPLSRLLKIAVRDIPDAWRLIQVNTTVLDILNRLQSDVSTAKSLPKSFQKYTLDDKTLLVELPNEVICYRRRDDELIRYKLNKTDTSAAEATATWLVPNAKIKWNIHRKKDEKDVLEVQHYIERRIGRRLEKKMANSHLYFMAAYKGI